MATIATHRYALSPQSSQALRRLLRLSSLLQVEEQEAYKSAKVLHLLTSALSVA